MSWTQTDPMLQRAALLADFQRGLYSKAELARRYGVSRKTVYKWIGRWQSGERSTEDRSRAPLSCPHAHDEATREAALAVRIKHPTWGARKITTVLARDQPELPPVGHAAVSRWLAQAGLVQEAHSQAQRSGPGVGRAHAAHARRTRLDGRLQGTGPPLGRSVRLSANATTHRGGWATRTAAWYSR